MGIYICKDGTEIKLVPMEDSFGNMTLDKNTTDENRIKFIESYNENEVRYNPTHPRLLPLDWCKNTIKQGVI